jgi:hypothetical protein
MKRIFSGTGSGRGRKTPTLKNRGRGTQASSYDLSSGPPVRVTDETDYFRVADHTEVGQSSQYKENPSTKQERDERE